MHLMIDIGIIIGIFSYAMFVLYLAWVSPDTVKRLPDNFKHAATKVRARLRPGPYHPTTHSPPDRVEVPEPRPDEQVSTSKVFSGADAVNGLEHPAADVDGARARTRGPTAGVRSDELIAARLDPNNNGSRCGRTPDRK